MAKVNDATRSLEYPNQQQQHQSLPCRFLEIASKRCDPPGRLIFVIELQPHMPWK